MMTRLDFEAADLAARIRLEPSSLPMTPARRKLILTYRAYVDLIADGGTPRGLVWFENRMCEIETDADVLA